MTRNISSQRQITVQHNRWNYSSTLANLIQRPQHKCMNNVSHKAENKIHIKTPPESLKCKKDLCHVLLQKKVH